MEGGGGGGGDRTWDSGTEKWLSTILMPSSGLEPALEDPRLAERSMKKEAPSKVHEERSP